MCASPYSPYKTKPSKSYAVKAMPSKAWLFFLRTNMNISQVFESPLFSCEPVRFLDKYWLFPNTGLTCLAGEAKAGKTLLACQIALNHALTGTNSVIWYDLERNSSFGKRILETFPSHDVSKLKQSNFNFETVLEDPNLLSSDDSFEAFLDEIRKPNQLVIVDSLNQLQARRPVTEYVNVIHSETAFFTSISTTLNRASSLLLIHHHNKAGGISGTSAVSQCCDTIVDMSIEKAGQGICASERKVITRIGRNVPILKLYYDLSYPYFSFTEK
jgi:hypothetical protein